MEGVRLVPNLAPGSVVPDKGPNDVVGGRLEGGGVKRRRRGRSDQRFVYGLVSKILTSVYCRVETSLRLPKSRGNLIRFHQFYPRTGYTGPGTTQ